MGFKRRETFEGWDFLEIWDIDEGEGFPFLREPNYLAKSELPENFSPLQWPVNSTKVTLWHGQLDNISQIENSGFDIEDEIGAGVSSASDGMVVFMGNNALRGDYVLVNLILDGGFAQIEYANVEPADELYVGRFVKKGERIGSVKQKINEGLLELTILLSADEKECKADQSNVSATDPFFCFDMREIVEANQDYLLYPMEVNLDVSSPSQASEDDIRYARNLDLGTITCFSGETGAEPRVITNAVYLYKYVYNRILNRIKLFDKFTKIDDILTFDAQTGIATISFLGESFQVGAALTRPNIIDNATTNNNRIVVDRGNVDAVSKVIVDLTEKPDEVEKGTLKEALKKPLVIKGMGKMLFDNQIMISTNFPENLNGYTHNTLFNRNIIMPEDGIVRIWYSIANGGARYEPRNEVYHCIAVRSFILQKVESSGVENTLKFKIHNYNCQVGEIVKTSYDVPDFFESKQQGTSSTFPIWIKKGHKAGYVKKFELQWGDWQVMFISTIKKDDAAICGFIDLQVSEGMAEIVDYTVLDKNSVKNIPDTFYQASNREDVSGHGNYENIDFGDDNFDINDYVIDTNPESPYYNLHFKDTVDLMDYKCYSVGSDSYRLFCKTSVNVADFNGKSRNIAIETGNARSDNKNKRGDPSYTDIIGGTLADLGGVNLQGKGYPVSHLKNDGNYNGEFYIDSDHTNSRYLISSLFNYYNLGNWSVEYLMEIDIVNNTNFDKEFDLVLIPAGDAGFFYGELSGNVFGKVWNIEIPNPNLVNGKNKMIFAKNSQSIKKYYNIAENKYYGCFKTPNPPLDEEDVIYDFNEIQVNMDNRGVEFYNRQAVKRTSETGTIYDKIDLTPENNVTDDENSAINRLLKSFRPIKSITAAKNKTTKINYLYVLATQTGSHMFHVLVPRT
jgi:hypothetical protein